MPSWWRLTLCGLVLLASVMGVSAKATIDSQTRSDVELMPLLRRLEARDPHIARLHRMRMALKRDNTTNATRTDTGGVTATDTAPAGTVEPSAGCKVCSSSLKFANATKYQNGNQIPSLPFKTKTSWSGEMPISKGKNGEDRAYFFWLWGKDGKDDNDTDLVVWLNGGPGCSSLVGMTTELGPWLYTERSTGPHPNEYSWTRAAHMLFLEQPVGVGFTEGAQATLTAERDVAADFDSFLHSFFEVFPELKGRKLYVTGESYGGYYIPNLAAYQYAHGNKYNLQGTLIGDGKFSTDAGQQDLVTWDMAQRFKTILGFDFYDMEPLRLRATKCNYAGYLKDNLQYPPKGPLPAYNASGCFCFYSIYYYAKGLIPNFNVYNIKKPHNQSNDPLGPQTPDPFDPTQTSFDGADLQRYVHAPVRKWDVCHEVFKHHNGAQVDGSQPVVVDGTMQKMIEGSKRSILLAGGLDMLLPIEGIQLVMQNVTWNGKQGFSTPPDKPYADIFGNTQHATHVTERGLSLIIVPESGHMVPADQPTVALKALYDLIDKQPPAPQQATQAL